MNQLFVDFPDALANTQNITEKIEFFELDSDPIMPEFPIPESFGTMEEYREKFSEEDMIEEFKNAPKKLDSYEHALRVKFECDYLTHLVYLGATSRYGAVLDKEVKERIEFELDTIKSMGFPG